MMTRLLGASSLLLLLAVARSDDPDMAALRGRIADENNCAIDRATIVAKNVFSRDVWSARSDAAGMYELSGMRQGRYSVFVSAEGYGCKSLFNVLLFRGKNTELDVTLSSANKSNSDDCAKGMDGQK